MSGILAGTAGAAAASFGILMVALSLWAGWMSAGEGEPRAARRMIVLGLALALPFLGGALLPHPWGTWVSLGLIAAAGVLAVVLLAPLPGGQLPDLGQPVHGVDERDIMFARAVLEPGSERFEAYYRSRPENRAPDDAFRKEPGLLSPDAAHHHPLAFPAADAAFWTIERLRPSVEGHEATGATSGMKLGGEADEGAEDAPAGRDPEGTSRFLKAWLGKMGAHSVGITKVRDHHLYTHVGRGTDYGEPVTLDHPFALAITVEMDKEMVDAAPRSPTAMESALQYVRAGVMAVQVTDLIRRLGYRARAHIDGNYRVICPLVARDAGLGEIGRMGLLMTPKLGPRVRIAVVTTDMPLVPDVPVRDLTTIDFCLKCRKCADSCPSRALPFSAPEKDENGVLKWKIDPEACFTLWAKLGTDCARCMAVCPYSHPDNLLHTPVRWGIRNNALFRSGALWMDDRIYGRRPPPKELPDWMKLSESGGAEHRSDS